MRWQNFLTVAAAILTSLMLVSSAEGVEYNVLHKFLPRRGGEGPQTQGIRSSTRNKKWVPSRTVTLVAFLVGTCLGDARHCAAAECD